MSDLISRQAILEHIEKTRQKVQMMDDTHRASITMTGMYLCEKAVRNQPSAEFSRIEIEMHGKTPEEQCEFLMKLLDWSKGYTDSRLAMISWFGREV